MDARRRKGTGFSMGNGNKHLFASALTGKGFHSFWGEVLADLQHLYLLRGPSPGDKSVFLRLLGHALTERGYRINYCHRPGSHLALEGLVVMPLRAAILDRSCTGLYGISAPPYLRVVEIDLPRQGYRQKPDYGEDELQGRLEAMRLLEEAARIWEDTCAFFRLPGAERASHWLGSGWINELLEKPSRLKHFFAGTVTAEGPVDFIDHLTSGCRKRYFIRGAPGTGGPMVQDALFRGLSRHWDVEAYHSYIDPEYMVALIFPEIGLAIVDGTCGFALSPLPGDIVCDLPGYQGEGRAFAHAARTTGKQAELDDLLKAAGRALSRFQKSAVPTGVSGQDVAAFVSRFLKEIANP